MTAEQILLLVLGVTLAVFLILAIVLLVALLKVVKKVRAMADTAETALHNVTSITNLVRDNIKPAFVSATVVKVIKNLISNQKGGKRGKN